MPLKAGALAGRGVWAVRAMVAAAFVLLLGAMVGVLVASERAARAQGWISHTIEVRRDIERLKGALVDMETSQRGFLLTRQESLLAPYETARDDVQVLMTRLRQSTADNPHHRAVLDRLEILIVRRLSIIRQTIDAARHGNRATAIRRVSTGEGPTLMAAIRTELAAMDAEESRLFSERTRAAARERSLLLVLTVAALLLVIGVGAALFYISGRYIRTLEERTTALKNEIMARERSEAMLRQAQKMDALGRLTGGIAHDFNNMLQIITGSLQLLSRRMADADDRATKLTANALEAAERAGALTSRLLAFSRQQPLEPKPLDVNRLVSSASQMLGRTLGGEVKVETVLAGGLWNALVDAPQLESAIVNLAVNARDAMNGKGKITIETANTYLDQHYASDHPEVAPGQYGLIGVSDNGSGMPPEVIEQAFEPFFTTKPRGAGTGLGLSQVHGFIKQSGGHVKIYSELGAGTTVKLYLPRHVGEAERQEHRSVAHDASIGCSVLLVEDDAGVRAFASEALHELGCRVVEAENGEEALLRLQSGERVGVMLTDVVMPGMTGRQLADRVLELRPEIKIIYMTGFTQNAIVHNGVVDPGTRLLTKPFTLSQLQGALTAALDEAKAGERADEATASRE